MTASPQFAPSIPASAPPPARPRLSLAPSPQARADAALLQDLASGDHAAWTAIITRYRGLLHHVTRQTGLGQQQREDVLQTTWLRLFEHAAEIRRPEVLATWLVTTTVREAVRLKKQTLREQPSDALPDHPAPADDPGDVMHLRLAAGRLREAMERLPERERLLVTELVSTDGLSYTEIALKLGMPVGAIGPVRQRALRRLLPLLEGCWAE